MLHKKIKKQENFSKGKYLTLDLYGCKAGNLGSVSACYDYLDKMPYIMGMEKIAPPCVVNTDGEKYPDKAGISAWIPLNGDTHCCGISIHTLTPSDFISIDVFGYGDCNFEEVKKYTIDFFKPSKIESEEFIRES